MPAPASDRGDRLEYRKSIEGKGGARLELTPASEFLTHFNKGATIPPGLTLTETTPIAAATYGTGLGGTAVLSPDDIAGNQSSLTTGLLWQANRQTEAVAGGQPLVFEAKWRANVSVTVEYFVGLTDAVADTNPIALSATSTFTTSAPDDFALLGYSATPTSGAAFTAGGNQHVAITGDSTVDAVAGTGGGAFVVDTYYTSRVQVDVAGNCAFFVNGAFIASRAGGVSADVPLCGIVVAIPRTTSGVVMTIDYLYIGGV